MKTLKQLAEMVADNERELAPGSETTILGVFVSEYGTVGAVLEMDDVELDRDETDEYNAYKIAYDRLRSWEEDEVEYDEYELWTR